MNWLPVCLTKQLRVAVIYRRQFIFDGWGQGFFVVTVCQGIATYQCQDYKTEKIARQPSPRMCHTTLGRMIKLTEFSVNQLVYTSKNVSKLYWIHPFTLSLILFYFSLSFFRRGRIKCFVTTPIPYTLHQIYYIYIMFLVLLNTPFHTP